MKQILLVLAACVGWGCAAGRAKTAPPAAATIVDAKTVEENRRSHLAHGIDMFFVGNSYMGNDGGLPIHIEQAWPHARTPVSVETRAEYFWGKPLGAMYTETVETAIEKGDFDVCVITSGTVDEMMEFTPVIGDHCGSLLVYMTWGRNPTISTMEKYREETAAIVADMRAYEAKTDARVVPSGLVFYDLVVRPPREGLRQDWLYFPQNIHQNAVGTAINVYTFYAAFIEESPLGIVYDLETPADGVVISGEKIATRKAEDGSYLYDEIVFDEAFRAALQQRAWDITEQWRAKKTEFDG